MKLSFRSRVALYYMLATALVIAIAFFTVFILVKSTIYQNLDEDLSYEAAMHLRETGLENGKPVFLDREEWEEREHREVQVNPVFVQIMDSTGRYISDKSPNLKEDKLLFFPKKENGSHFNTYLKDQLIRQVQVRFSENGKNYGYIITAMSFEASQEIISRLAWILIICYPVILFGLFFISRFLAGRSIKPITEITRTTNRISRYHLNERVSLPENKDELFDLSFSINELLDRIEQALERERQFTSDASHELRTPIASIRGNLEVLIRKERSKAEYENTIKYSLSEIDRMSVIIEQLLSLARYDKKAVNKTEEHIEIVTILDEIISLHSGELKAKNLKLIFNAENAGEFYVHYHYAFAILNNIIGNATKYSYNNSTLTIQLTKNNDTLLCKITDEGIGIKQEDLDKIFNPFYRSSALEHSEIKGSGLGLSIVQKAAEAIEAEIKVTSTKDKGSSFSVVFKPILRKSSA
ncbi:HAMP domain-containing sensor histidine kinase [Zunongwangia sp. F363]|uniref:histidine kinase n=1 Tax=Autumnicola tepida TaxID=3075595 RepID=A0ABU3C9T3_9FLAO|nr:HAMP domain-containing sensor histidine kinase [Zunongwangia sp. F363]MDT0643097.1 HAMP domain-containing sensor histidine kinase [Zunongwangia sp. F363]